MPGRFTVPGIGVCASCGQQAEMAWCGCIFMALGLAAHEQSSMKVYLFSVVEYSQSIINLLQPCNFLRLVLKLFRGSSNVYCWVFTITSLKKPPGLRFPAIC